MNYSTEKTFPEAVSKEKHFTNFFRNVQAASRNSSVKVNVQKWNDQDEALSEALRKT